MLNPSPDQSGRPVGDRLNPCANQSGRPTDDRLTPCPDQSGRPTDDMLNPSPDQSGRPVGDRLNPCANQSGRPTDDRLNPCPDQSGRPTDDRLTPCPDQSGRPTDDRLTPCPGRSGRPVACLGGRNHPEHVRCDVCPDTEDIPVGSPSCKSDPTHSSEDFPKIIPYGVAYLHHPPTPRRYQNLDGTPFRVHTYHTIPEEERVAAEIQMPGDRFSHHDKEEEEKVAPLSNQPNDLLGWFQAILSGHHDNPESPKQEEDPINPSPQSPKQEEDPINPSPQLPCNASRPNDQTLPAGSAPSSPVAPCTETAHRQPLGNYRAKSPPKSSDTSVEQGVETTHPGFSASENHSETAHLKSLEVGCAAEATLPRAPVNTQQETETNTQTNLQSGQDNRRQRSTQPSAPDVTITMETSGESRDSDVTRTTDIDGDTQTNSEEDRKKVPRNCGWKSLKVSDVLWGLVIVGVIVGLVVVVAYPNGPTKERKMQSKGPQLEISSLPTRTHPTPTVASYPTSQQPKWPVTALSRTDPESTQGNVKTPTMEVKTIRPRRAPAPVPSRTYTARKQPATSNTVSSSSQSRLQRGQSSSYAHNWPLKVYKLVRKAGNVFAYVTREQLETCLAAAHKKPESLPQTGQLPLERPITAPPRLYAVRTNNTITKRAAIHRMAPLAAP
ncbi:uncharacterized protein LOC118415001 [Branchiostoma floridae]|uniref:Uncharacterized protein LOC118415001 n=1 Tax=Branchiostoma floridae TaxID=7739 RepID=A0A9J7MPY6_BRAFL|nr:uncharacterized protein LOC118415001 [Branchiostoma floridae]